MIARFASLLTLALLSQSGILYAELQSSPTVDQFINSDVVCVVSPQDITTSAVARELILSKGAVLKGDASFPIKISEPSGLWPSKAGAYVVFLSKKDSKLVPASKLFYAIGFDPSISVTEETVSTVNAFFQFLAEALAIENAPAPAALQSYLIGSAPTQVRFQIWEKVRKNRSRDPYVALSVATVGLKEDGASLLRSVPTCPTVQKEETAAEGIYATDFFLGKVSGLVSIWLQKHATEENAADILTFASMQQSKLSTTALIAVGTKLSLEDVRTVLEIYNRPDSNWEARYAALRALAQIFERPDLIPPATEFQKNPEPVINGIMGELKQRGL